MLYLAIKLFVIVFCGKLWKKFKSGILQNLNTITVQVEIDSTDILGVTRVGVHQRIYYQDVTLVFMGNKPKGCLFESLA